MINVAYDNNPTIVYDSSKDALKNGKKNLNSLINKLTDKGKYSEKEKNAIKKNLKFTNDINDLKK